MAVAFVAHTAKAYTDGATSLSMDIPSHTNGDILLLIVASSADSSDPAAAMDTPSGWTSRIDVEAGGSSAVRITAFTKAGNGSETSASWTNTATVGIAGGVTAFSGALAAPDVTGSAASEAITDQTAPSVTTTVANTAIIYGFVCDSRFDSSASDIDSDAGFNGTNRSYAEGNGNGDGNGFAVCISDELQALSGASNSCVFSMEGEDAACAITIALAPTVAGGNPKGPLGMPLDGALGGPI